MSKEKIFKTIENFGNKIRRINPLTIFDFLSDSKETDFFIISCHKTGYSVEEILDEIRKEPDLYEKLEEKIHSSKENVIIEYIKRTVTSYNQNKNQSYNATSC